METNFKSYISFLLFFSCLQTSYSQKKETIYILFDKNQGDNCWTLNSTDTVFSLKENEKIDLNSKHKLNRFVFKPSTHKKLSVNYCDVKGKLISGLEAIKKVDAYLKKQPTGLLHLTTIIHISIKFICMKK